MENEAKISQKVNPAPAPAPTPREIPDHLLKSELAQVVRLKVAEAQSVATAEHEELARLNRAFAVAEARHRQVVQEAAIGAGWFFVFGGAVAALARLYKR